MTARASFAGPLALVKQLAIALGWIVLYTAVALALSVVVYAGIAWVSGVRGAVPPEELWSQVLLYLAPVAGLLGATWWVGVVLARRDWAALGWRWGGRAFGRGLGMGVVLAAGAVGIAIVAGARVTIGSGAGAWAAHAAPLALFLLAAALAEELAFRGFPLRRLADAIGPLAATLVLAVGFAAAHVANPNIGPFGLANIALAGVWLSAAFFSGGMPLAWGLHVGWNGGLALLFDAPVSGHGFAVPAVEYAPGGWPWLDGGAFGPEGGLLGSLALVVGTLWVVDRRAPRPGERLAA